MDISSSKPIKTHKKLPLKEKLKRFMFITIGAILMAIALELFLVPNKLLDGGIVGISIMMSHFLKLPIGLFIFILNIPFFYLGYKQIGKTFALSTLYGIGVLSIGTALLHPVPAFADEKFLVTIFGGAILGLGVGFVIRYGGSLDGTEILAILINNKTPFSVGEIVMIINFFIYTVAGFVFTWESAMYSVIAYFIAFKTIDIVQQGLDESKSVWIISEQYEEIGDAINDRLGRGVTYLKGEGAYTGDNKKVIFCVITRLEEFKLKDIVNHYDESAFVAIGNVSEVKGGRFKKRDIH
ncbi:YitT family protein [Macrococcoides canis]|uniref:YitT family protein n=1 Tax=Macrococcoides canis TaxID=1855823 RepID=A0A4R6C3M4_9STAP|nr:YitT family protein [Macrococcus canis]MEE1107153.1 YitT family protein [Macrococcus canis]TDM16120.1 YitT family protein [Macrococcus canis]TDM20127.1 YitT family protein [Macrococcus canis]TDM23110.1 YitT family protein [Macrococcus canis]TDM30924.1 YitT family protein [Macrococcus canis]